MHEVFTHRVLKHMADSRYQPSNTHELARALGIDEKDYDAFQDAVRQMVDARQVLRGPTDTVILPPPGAMVMGTIRVNPKGFGFIVPDALTEHGDLFVPPGRTGNAMDGDRVRAKVTKERRGGAKSGRSPYVATVVEIVQRADNRFVGNLHRQGKRWFVHVDGKSMNDPVIVRDVGAKNAKEGDKVVMELIRYPSERQTAEGVITEVLGESGEPDVETKAVIHAYGLREGFTEDVMNEARAAARTLDPDTATDPKANGGREDLTDTFILTIDPPDARDFDDAISIRRIDKAESGAAWELGVHIADVSHYVKQGTLLDEEAYARGNSTYLPRHVVPMLPELLSNGVCSLQEGVPRFCTSVFIVLDEDAKVLSQRFAKTVIKSNKRLTYLEAQAVIDDDIREAVRNAKTEAKYSPELITKLKQMDELAKLILKRRRSSGMIELGLPEVNLVFDDSGRVVDAEKEDDAFTHRLIEMFMVEANEAAARLFNSLNAPMIRRTHPDPPSHDTNELRQFARVAGFNIPANPTRFELQSLLRSVEGKPAQHAVHLAVLQTLSRAEYAPLLIGHFALASEHYTHFTSPIRRYPDLIIHRGIASYLELLSNQDKLHDANADDKENANQTDPDKANDGKKSHGKRRSNRQKLGRDLVEKLPNEDKLQEMARHCSLTERNSEAAERSLRNFLVLELMSTLLGEDFEGTITGVTGSGVFVQIDRYLVDGFIRTAEIAESLSPRGERWKLNRTTGALVADRSGKTITIGDRFMVRIARVDPAGQVLDLAILAPLNSSRKMVDTDRGDDRRQKRKQPAGGRKGHAKSKGAKGPRSKGGNKGPKSKGPKNKGPRGKGKRGR